MVRGLSNVGNARVDGPLDKCIANLGKFLSTMEHTEIKKSVELLLLALMFVGAGILSTAFDAALLYLAWVITPHPPVLDPEFIWALQ